MVPNCAPLLAELLAVDAHGIARFQKARMAFGYAQPQHEILLRDRGDGIAGQHDGAGR